MEHKHTCPRRYDGFLGMGADESRVPKDLDTYRGIDGRGGCSFCGSMHPDEFMELARGGAELTPTDKNYKVYVGGGRTPKFYFQHLSVEQRQEFIDLYNARKLKLAYPGYFYRMPFFMRPEKPDEIAKTGDRGPWR